MPNLGQINKNAINEQVIKIVASGNLVQIEQDVVIIGSGAILQAEQVVGIVASGALMDFEQTVQLRITGSGSIVDIEQSVNTTASGNILNFIQYVFDTASETPPAPPPLTPESAPSWYIRNGWDLIIQIGSEVISNDKIHGKINIERKEGTAALADITLIPDSGVQDVVGYSGKTITIDARTSTGVRRLFTGIVDIPDVRVIEKKIILRCSDRREEKINSSLGSLVSTIGAYSADIFNANDSDTATQLRDRLSTVPSTLDFDSYGVARVTSLLAKSTADYELADAEVFRKEPKIDFLSRARITNSVKVDYKYRYTRLYHWTRNFSWTSPINSDFCLFLQSGYQLTPKRMITQAALAAKWPIDGTITFTDTPGAGWYCGGIGWLATSSMGYYTQVTDEQGNTVSDQAGNAVFGLGSVTGQQNLTSLFATAATWTAGTRWSQIIEEKYSFTVQASQSVAQYGAIEGYVGSEYETPAEVEEFEEYFSYDDRGLGANHSFDLDLGRQNFNVIQNIVLNQAKTTIIKSHRDTRVTFFRTLWPEVELHHTVRINTGPVVATGKVFKIKHTLDALTGLDETEVTLALSKSEGSATTTVPSYLTKPTDTTFSPDTSTISLTSRYGQDPDTEAAAAWTGYIGNITLGNTITNYSSRFIVDTPPVPSEYRDLRVLNGGVGSTYDVEIQNDELVITF